MVALVVLAEVAVPPLAEERIADQVADRVPEAASVRADLQGVPVVTRVLAAGEVERLVVTLDQVVRPELTLDRVRVELEGMALSRSELLAGEVALERIDRGSIEGEVTENAILAAAGGVLRSVELTPGRVEVSTGDVTVGGTVGVDAGSLVLAPDGLPAISVPLPVTDLFPCSLAAAVVEGRVVVSCRVDEVPAWLVRELSPS